MSLRLCCRLRVSGPLKQIRGAALLFDYDLDGDLDLLEVAGTEQRLARNDGGKFTDVTTQSGALAKTASASGTAAIAGDYDNDSRPDLFILRQGASTLYHNDGKGSFSDVTVAAKIATSANLSSSAAFVDFDHDGDLDILLAGEGYLLLRNNGDGTFSDQTAAAKLADKVPRVRSCRLTLITGATSTCSSLRLKRSRSGATCVMGRFAMSRLKSDSAQN